MEGVLSCRFCVLHLQIVFAVCVLPLLISGQPDSTDACFIATVETEVSRHFNESSVDDRCDSGLVPGWYRFSLNGRPAEITTRCIKNNHCGTELPLHIELGENDLPDANETTMAHVCGSYNILGRWDCCVLRKTVYIKNCTDFYVYHLQPTDRCPVAYCLQVKGEYPYPNMTVKTGEPVHQSNNAQGGDDDDPNLQPSTPHANATTTTTTTPETTNSAFVSESDTSTTTNTPSIESTVSSNLTTSSVQSSSTSTQPSTTVSSQTSNSTTTSGTSTPSEESTSNSTGSPVTTTQPFSSPVTTHTSDGSTSTLDHSTSVASLSSTTATSSNLTFTSTDISSNQSTTPATQPSTQTTDVTPLTTQSTGNGPVSNMSESNTSVAMTTETPLSMTTASAPVDLSTTIGTSGNSSSSAPDSVSTSSAPDIVSTSSAPNASISNSTETSSAPDIVSTSNAPETMSTSSASNSVSTSSASNSVSTSSASDSVSTSSALGVLSTSRTFTNNSNLECGLNASESYSCGNKTCFRLPNGEMKMVCHVNSTHRACVDVCNTFPDCMDGADEQGCASHGCSEGQTTCPNKPGCYNDCDDPEPSAVVFHLNAIQYREYLVYVQNATLTADLQNALLDSINNITGMPTWTTDNLNCTDSDITQGHYIDVTCTLNISQSESTRLERYQMNDTFRDGILKRFFEGIHGDQFPSTNTTTSLPHTNTTETASQAFTTSTTVAAETSTSPSLNDTSEPDTLTSSAGTETSPVPISDRQTTSTVTTVGNSVNITPTVIVDTSTNGQRDQTSAMSTSHVPLDSTTITSERNSSTINIASTQTVSTSSSPTITTPSSTLSNNGSFNTLTPAQGTNRTRTSETPTSTHSTSRSNISSTHGTQPTSVSSTNIPTVSSTTTRTNISTNGNTVVTTSSAESTSMSSPVTTVQSETTSIPSTESGSVTSYRTTDNTGTTVITLTSTQTPASSSRTLGTTLSTVSDRQSTSASASHTTPVTSGSDHGVSSTISSIATSVSMASSEPTSSQPTHSSALASSTSSSPAIAHIPVSEHATFTTEDTTDIRDHTADSLNTVETPTDYDDDDENEIVKLFNQNTGLFIFLIIAGTAMLGICIFGIGGTIYQKRMRTWQPTLDDKYPDMEKSIVSIGRDQAGIESPIPDIDILQGEETGEGESLSKASTLVCGPTPERLQGTSPRGNDAPLTGTSSGLSSGFGSLNGQANDAFHSDESLDLDGVTPYEELDERYPRNKFPWIENAEDTKV